MALKRFFIHIITWNFSNNINCFRERKNTSVFEEELRINFRPISNIVGLFGLLSQRNWSKVMW